MHLRNSYRPTIGFLSTWAVYEGTTIDSFTDMLLKGVCAAARDRRVNLLLGCGISHSGSPRGSRTAWPTPGETSDFIPVGPWNCDGLVVIPDDMTEDQNNYIQDLIRSGYPVILTTTEKPGPHIAVDNAAGIRQAVRHLYQHGHRQIAYIAGKKGRTGDSAERLTAYREALRELELPIDERLIAYGEHRHQDGRQAVESLLRAQIPFTALVASNDLSAFGALEALRAAGLRAPEDIAVIGFDDIFEARTQVPPLTTVHHPTFSLGYHAVLAALQAVHGEREKQDDSRVSTHLVIRQSCGCRPGGPQETLIPASFPIDSENELSALARWMQDAALIESRQSSREEIAAHCARLSDALTESVTRRDTRPFQEHLENLYRWLEKRPQDAYVWQAIFTTLRNDLPHLLPAAHAAPDQLPRLIDIACLRFAELIQRQTEEELVKRMTEANRLGLMTSQLLRAADVQSSGDILAQHLPQLGIHQAFVGLFSPSDEDPLLQTDVLFNIGLNQGGVEERFLTHHFPPASLKPKDEPFQLAVLPLFIDERNAGFAAFSAANLDPCAAIVQNLASALRASQLYRDALQGKLMAEEANRLKSRFLSIVSHELQTPLSLVVGLSEMILQDASELSEATQHDLGQIHASAQHLARLIADVLDLASSEAGKLRILREPLDLAEVLRVAARIGEQLAGDKGLRWEANLPRRGPWVLGDRTRLRQVALNLISNAVKFTPEGKVVLEVVEADQRVIISVSDTGIGILPSELDSVFGEFQRSERSIQSGSGGMGLGLAITRQLVEQHGGALGVRSPGDLGRGSTFYLTLPVLSATSWQDELAPSLPEQRQTVFVLSERDSASAPLDGYLRQRGFDIQNCQIAQEKDWLSRVTSTQPAAIILEEEVASKEGWAIISLLKRQNPTANTPIFAYALDAARDRGELLELNYLHKPLQADQLEAEMTRYFGEKDRPANSEPRLVLLVDDDPGVLEVNQRLVEQAGCRAMLARHGKAALQALETHRPDLILLDLMMPEMDGFAVLDALREQEATRDIPVIILTARTLSDSDLERCNRGVATILTKGLFNAAETLSHIETALSRQNPLSMPTQRLIRQAVNWMHAHYAEPLTREDIAQSIGISPDYLTDCFRQEMGITPITYLRRYRIRQACELLKRTDLSVTQVAMEVGFSESAHFTRAFHREVGLTPRAYRKTGPG